MNSSQRVLLFDLGGVLADLGDPVAALKLDIKSERFWDIWLNSQQVRDYETGLSTTAEFALLIAAELGAPDTTQFEKRLRNWQLKLFRGTQAVLTSVAQEFRLALLSNTNELHWAQIQSSTNVFSIFSKLFLSFETHLYKPHPSAFEQVLDYFNCEPWDVIFLDDNAQNVSAARELGLQAIQVQGVEELQRAILSIRST